LLLSLLLFAQDVEREIYKTIIHGLFPNKERISVYVDAPSSFPKLRDGTIILVPSPKIADLILASKERTVLDNPHKIIFVNNFYLLQKYRSKVVGGFFWQKGRPNIIFLEKRIKVLRIQLPKDLQEFVDEAF
jgi:hypothetical protein